ncbi:hypothetical protein ABZS96_43295 [Streptomyces avermitilis]|uniref:hypothetical protein n=1 Tax=Streptomyces avermitilis TaxID=33903 RepID=UPI00339E4FCB
MLGGYGALVTVAWFPTALPSWTGPYLYTLVLAIPVASGALALVTSSQRSTPAPVRSLPPGPAVISVVAVEQGTTSPAGSGRRVAAAHMVSLATVLFALAAAGRLLAGSSADSLIVPIETLGLLLYVLNLVGAVFARHRAELGQRMHIGAACLMVAALLLTLESLLNEAATPLGVPLIPGLAGCVIVAGHTTVTHLHGLRVRNQSRAGGSWRTRPGFRRY